MAAQPIQAAGAVRPDAVNWNPSAAEISAYEQGGSLVSMDSSCWQLDGSPAKAARSAGLMVRPGWLIRPHATCGERWRRRSGTG